LVFFLDFMGGLSTLTALFPEFVWSVAQAFERREKREGREPE
jgi:hypothetical protein